MIYLDLLLTFLKIGAVSFGGGYGMLPLMQEEVLGHGWLTQEAFVDFIAVSESTPGPIAVNMATFIGSSQGGILGSAMATLGVVLPSFVIILLIVILLQNLLQYAGVQAFLKGVRPSVTALILSVAVTLGLSVFFQIGTVSDTVTVSWKQIAIFAIIVAVAFLYKKIRKKKIPPILLIVCGAALGMLLYGIF